MGQFIDFPEDERDTVDNVDIVDDTQEQGSDQSGEDILMEALKAYNNPDNFEESEEEDDEDVTDAGDDQDSANESAEDEETEQADNGQIDPEKPFKTPENAANAERRRQAEQRKLEQYRAQTPEYQIINTLAAARGVTPEQMLQEVQDAALRQQAEQQGVPLEFARQQKAVEDRMRELENQVALREYQDWENRITNEAQSLQQAFPFLTEEDITESKDLLLNKWRNVEAPLEQAVFALHGRKIAERQLEISRNETLAEVSGRKSQSGVPLRAGKASNTPVLTDEEKYVAKQMGISEEAYLKNKR